MNTKLRIKQWAETSNIGELGVKALSIYIQQNNLHIQTNAELTKLWETLKSKTKRVTQIKESRIQRIRHYDR